MEILTQRSKRKRSLENLQSDKLGLGQDRSLLFQEYREGCHGSCPLLDTAALAFSYSVFFEICARE